MEENREPAAVPMTGPFLMAFSQKAQLGAALFVLGRQGVAGLATRVHLWGRAWTVDDPCYRWNADDWLQFAVKVVHLSVVAALPRAENLPIEPTSVEAALLAAYGPSPPDATFHLPQTPGPQP